MDQVADKNKIAFVYSALTVITLAVFWQVHNFEFINYDDTTYVSQNNHILSGLKWSGVKWVFTHEHSCNWHPLTGLSHMLDCQLFGPNPGRHHLVNLLFHIANTLLLFTVFRKETGAFWQSAFVAALFAIHPLHVESVAWIAERKDVLSTLLWLLTIAAYFRYVKNRGTGNYILTLILFVLGLTAKPMLVTLPFVLLLLDYWPLNRLQFNNTRQLYRLVLEKIPFFVFSAISSIITFIVQQNAGTVRKIEALSVTVRAANAVLSYVKYIIKMFWPSNLAAFYPHRGTMPWWQVFAAAALLAIITICVIRSAPKHRYLPIGWFWYLGTLVPVIGMVQVGDQALADRYTYVPLIGLFIISAWGTNDLLEKSNYRKIILGLSSLAVISALSICAWFQTGYWRNGKNLFEHTLTVTGENYLAYNNLGTVLSEQGKYDEAIKLFHRALELRPYDVEALNNLGSTYGKLNRIEEEINAYKKAIALKPNAAQLYYNLGTAYTRLGHYQDSIAAFKQATEIQPDYTDAYHNLAAIYLQTGSYPQAIEACKRAIALEPEDPENYNTLAAAYRSLGRYPEAIEAYKRAIQLKPDYAEALNNLGSTYSRINRWQQAIEVLKLAVKNKPDFVEAYYNLAIALSKTGQYQQAVETCRQAIKINPNYLNIYLQLGLASSHLGLNEQAIQAFNQAIRIKPDFAEAYYNISVIYGGLGQYQEVIDSCRQATKINPAYAEAYFNLGVAYDRLGRFENAMQAFEQVVKLTPNNASAHFALGAVYLKSGDKDSAIKECEILKGLDAEKAKYLSALINKNG